MQGFFALSCYKVQHKRFKISSSLIKGSNAWRQRVDRASIGSKYADGAARVRFAQSQISDK